MNNAAKNTAARNKAARTAITKSGVFVALPTFKASAAGPLDADTHKAVAKHIKPGTYAAKSFEGRFLMDMHVSDEMLARLEAEN